MTPSESKEPLILTVSQLSHAIKLSLETTFPLIWLQGEISNCKPHSSGHLYFSLKDANAQIAAVMFRQDAQSLKSAPKDGAQVIVRGEINVYPLTGKYQIIVREMKLVGLGELLLKLEELKIKLNKLGWFRKERKRAIPKFPKKIGVVTSPTGAVIQDMLHILTRRFSGFHLILNPVKVQGEGAAQEIAKAIEQFNAYNLVDVLIVGRGGGSIEDLWAFNEEIVAEAIYKSRIPVISAVGHETDHCIADYIADLRAPTPSAAAELVVAEQSQQLSHLAQIRRRMQQTVFQLIRQDRHRLFGLVRHPSLQSPYGILGPGMQKLDTLMMDIDDGMKQTLLLKRQALESKRLMINSLNPKSKLEMFKHKLLSLDKEIKATFERRLQACRTSLIKSVEDLAGTWRLGQARRKALLQPLQRFKQLDTTAMQLFLLKKERFFYLKESLDSINPKKLLTKGYCILFAKNDHSTITTVHSVKKEQEVRILLQDGSLEAIINGIQSEKSCS